MLDLGPGGGVNGGEIVAEGTPEVVAAEAGSFTGQYLRPLLERRKVTPVIVEATPKRPKRSHKTEPEEPDLISAK